MAALHIESPSATRPIWSLGRQAAVLALTWAGLLLLTLAAGRLITTMGWFARADRRVEARTQSVSGGLRHPADVITLFGSQPVAITGGLIALVVLLRMRSAQRAVPIVTYLGANGLTAVAKIVIARPGPGHRSTGPWYDYSFPSGHSAAAAAFMLSTALLLPATDASWRRVRRVAIATAVLLSAAVAASRVVLDVHWATDVVAGFVIGTAWAGAVAITLGHGRKRSREEAREPTALRV